jgi:hypothetical protein
MVMLRPELRPDDLNSSGILMHNSFNPERAVNML